MTGHRSRLCYFTIDVADLDAGVAFRSAVLDARPRPTFATSRHIYRRLRLPDSDILVLLQKTGDTKAGKERMHLDLETDDVDAEVRRVSKRSEPADGTTNKNAASTSGSSATHGTTSSASCRPCCPNCSPNGPHGHRSNAPCPPTVSSGWYASTR